MMQTDREPTVKSLQSEQLGNPATDPKVLKVVQSPRSQLQSNHVRIRVIAAALNFADALQGTYQEKPKLPFIPGNEASGVIIEVGRDVRSSLKVGDRVCAVTQGGAFAEEVTAPALCVIKLPFPAIFLVLPVVLV